MRRKSWRTMGGFFPLYEGGFPSAPTWPFTARESIFRCSRAHFISVSSEPSCCLRRGFWLTQPVFPVMLNQMDLCIYSSLRLCGIRKFNRRKKLRRNEVKDESNWENKMRYIWGRSKRRTKINEFWFCTFFCVFSYSSVASFFHTQKNKDGMVVSLQLLFLYVLECKERIAISIYHIMHLFYRAASGERKRRKKQKMDDCRLLYCKFFCPFYI